MPRGSLKDVSYLVTARRNSSPCSVVVAFQTMCNQLFEFGATLMYQAASTVATDRITLDLGYALAFTYDVQVAEE